MKYAVEAADNMKRELRKRIAESMDRVAGSDAPRVVDEILEQFVEITAPEYGLAPKSDIDDKILGIEVPPGGRGGAKLIKPGNIKFKFREFIVAISGGVSAIAGALSSPWLVVLGVIAAWGNVKSAMTQELDELDASVLWSMWEGRDRNDSVEKAGVLDLVNREREKFEFGPVTSKTLDRALEKLKKLGCIEQSADDPDRWWLRESVEVKFS